MEILRLIDSKETSEKTYQFLFAINGGFFFGYSIRDYWEEMNFSDYATEYIHQLIFYIVENNIRDCSKTYVLFDNFTVGFFSQRAFADLLAAVWAEMDEKFYSYLDFVGWNLMNFQN